jgi:hypothetical protein
MRSVQEREISGESTRNARRQTPRAVTVSASSGGSTRSDGARRTPSRSERSATLDASDRSRPSSFAVRGCAGAAPPGGCRSQRPRAVAMRLRAPAVHSCSPDTPGYARRRPEESVLYGVVRDAARDLPLPGARAGSRGPPLRRTRAPGLSAASSPTASCACAVTAAAASGSSPSPARAGASASPAAGGAWPTPPPTSSTGCSRRSRSASGYSAPLRPALPPGL